MNNETSDTELENTKRKVVVYGGAFSPPHIGHAIAIESMMRLFPCDEIWMMPTSDRFDKKMSAPAENRVAMLELWIKEYFDNPSQHVQNFVPELVEGLHKIHTKIKAASENGSPRENRSPQIPLLRSQAIPIKISELELKRPELTTTYKTKVELEEKYPNCDFYFYVGSDILKDVELKWVNGKELWKTANFIVFKKFDENILLNLPPNIILLDKEVILVNISSTFIRNLIKSGKSGMPYLPKSISEYIAEHNLYL